MTSPIPLMYLNMMLDRALNMLGRMAFRLGRS